MDILGNAFNLLLIVLGFGVLIFVHEMGHFLAAKWAGIRTEAFAVGMGPVITSWRKGVGLVLGSTHRKVVARTGKPPEELRDEELDKHGIGETEYSLRWIPIGGFVKMLGQEDANPNAVSDDPRSYTQCAIGKRMIVVSAGVIMNLILAAVFFVIAFMVGVLFPAPVIGDVSASLPASRAVAANAEALGITEPGLLPADRVLSIDGESTRTFTDLYIASSMGKPGTPIELVVQRAGYDEPLAFSIVPEKDRATGLLSIGITPASSTTIVDKDEGTAVQDSLRRDGLAQQGVGLGMTMLEANGRRIRTLNELTPLVEASDGQPLQTVWGQLDSGGNPEGQPIEATVDIEPSYQTLRYVSQPREAVQNFEEGLLGLVPMVRIEEVTQGSLNTGIVRSGDLVLRVGDVEAPRMADFREAVRLNAGKDLPLQLLRDGAVVEVTAKVNRKGMLNVLPAYARELALVAKPMVRVMQRQADDTAAAAEALPIPGLNGKSAFTPAADLDIMGRSRILDVGGTPVTDWADIRAAFRDSSAAALASEQGVDIPMTWLPPTPEAEPVAGVLSLTAAEVKSLHELGWRARLSDGIFDAVYTDLKAEGPIQAMTMGLEETYKLVVLTYLTIDRLVRGSVGVEQLRGPVGIVHLGSKIADRGIPYIIFFLAMISVNLAVINFLPIPIVDGGLFLFLVYEKIKGRPPSLAFQNAATIFGLLLIGTVLVVTFYNDVMRLIS